MMTPRSGPPSPVTAGSVATMAAAASRMTLKVPTRLIWMTRLKVSSGSTPSRPSTLPGVAIPAQLTTIRSGPSAAAASTAAWTWSSLVTSAGTKTAVLAGFGVPASGASGRGVPEALSRAANASPAEPGRSTSTTEAPASNSRLAVAAPRPEAPPVISATVPLTSMHPP